MNLKGKLLLGIAPVIVISTLFLGYFAYYKLGNQKEHDIIRQLELATAKVAAQSGVFFDSSDTGITALAQSNVLADYIAYPNSWQRRSRVQQLLKSLFSDSPLHDASHIHFQAYRVNPNGTCAALFSAQETTTWASVYENVCHEVAAPDTATYKKHFFDEKSGLSSFLSGVEIDLSEEIDKSSAIADRTEVVLVVSFDTTPLTNSIIEQHSGGVGSVFFIDKLGRIIFHSDPSQLGSIASSADVLTNNKKKKLHHKMHDQYHGLTYVKNFDGYEALAHTQKLNNNFLYVSILPLSDFKVAHNELLPTIVIVSFFTFLLTTGMLWGMVNVMVLAPIRRLQVTALDFGNGKFELDQNNSRTDEIGELENSLHDMGSRLATSITDLRDSHEQIQQLAYQDSLTGLPNRRRFLQSLNQSLQDSAQRGANEKTGVLFLDVDEFKRINDLLGHNAGDELLKVVANRLRTHASDFPIHTEGVSEIEIGRIGGDEFVVYVTGVTDEQVVFTLARSIKQALEEPITINKQQFTVSASIGIALYPEHGRVADDVLKAADTAMYEIKLANKNGCCLFTADMASKIEKKAQLEYELRGAIARNELSLVYQPQIGAVCEEVFGVEALLRWQHPELGNIPPDLFIPIAEEFGLISTIGEWVLDMACAQWKQWYDEGRTPKRIAVNVSQRQLSQIDLIAQVTEVLNKYDMPPTALELELTESCMMEAPLQIVESIQKIRDLGVRIALDDFGTGYSSLASLAILPIDTIKLDRSFVADVNEKTGTGSIVSAVLTLAKDLNLESVAEGVETELERGFLQDRECDVLQGYLLSRPMDATKTGHWLSNMQKTEHTRRAA